jgi:hypothetical protein
MAKTITVIKVLPESEPARSSAVSASPIPAEASRGVDAALTSAGLFYAPTHVAWRVPRSLRSGPDPATFVFLRRAGLPLKP